MRNKKILAASLSLGLVFLGANKAYAEKEYIEKADINVLSISKVDQESKEDLNKEDVEDNSIETNPKSILSSIQVLKASRSIDEDDKNNKSDSKDKYKENNEEKNPIEIEKSVTDDSKDQENKPESETKEDLTKDDSNESKEHVIIDKESSDDNKGNKNSSNMADVNESDLTNGTKDQAYPKGTTIEIKKVSNVNKKVNKSNTEAGYNPKTGIFTSSSVFEILIAASAVYSNSKRR